MKSQHVYFLGYLLLQFLPCSLLALPLLVARIGANDAHDTLAPDDLAVPADFFYRCSYFHFVSPAGLADCFTGAFPFRRQPAMTSSLGFRTAAT